MSTDNIKVIDLFCGIGGLSHGFVMEGFNVIAGFDFDKTCSYAYEHNNAAKFFNSDITELDSKDLSNLYGSAMRILDGCETMGTGYFVCKTIGE